MLTQLLVLCLSLQGQTQVTAYQFSFALYDTNKISVESIEVDCSDDKGAPWDETFSILLILKIYLINYEAI